LVLRARVPGESPVQPGLGFVCVLVTRNYSFGRPNDANEDTTGKEATNF
jgi:hypothetical protein